MKNQPKRDKQYSIYKWHCQWPVLCMLRPLVSTNIDWIHFEQSEISFCLRFPSAIEVEAKLNQTEIDKFNRSIRTKKYGIHGPAGFVGWRDTISQISRLFENSRTTVSSASVTVSKFGSFFDIFFGVVVHWTNKKPSNFKRSYFVVCFFDLNFIESFGFHFFFYITTEELEPWK